MAGRPPPSMARTRTPASPAMARPRPAMASPSPVAMASPSPQPTANSPCMAATASSLQAMAVDMLPREWQMEGMTSHRDMARPPVMALHRAMASHNRGMGGQAREDRGAREEGRARQGINGLEQLPGVTVEGGSRPGQLYVQPYYKPSNNYIYSRVTWFYITGAYPSHG